MYINPRPVLSGVRSIGLPVRWLAMIWLALAVRAWAAERPTIRIGVEENSPPLSFYDAKQGLGGFSADLLREVGQAEGIDFQIVWGSWSFITGEFEQGRLDALANTAITPDRQATMDFSIGHAYLHAITFTREGERPIRTTADFAGKMMGVVPGSLSHLTAAEHDNWGARIKLYSSRPAVLRAVANRECDFALFLRPTGDDLSATVGLHRAFVDDLVHRFHVAVHRGDTRTAGRINEGLAAVMRSGAFDRIYARWIGPIEPHPLHLADLRPYYWPLALVVLAVAGLFWWQRRVAVQLKRLAASLKESESRFRGISEHSLVGFYIVQDGKFTYVNPALAAIYGYEPGELMGRSHEFLIHPDDRAMVAENMRRRADREIDFIRYNLRGVRKDGTVVEIDVLGSRMDLAGGSAVIGNIVDVTEHRRAERLLRESLADLEEAQRVARVGSWRLDLASNRVVWTEQLYRMLGLDPGTSPPDYTEHSRLFTAESWQRLAAALDRTRNTGEPYELELEFVRPEGSRGWMLARGEPIRDNRGTIVGLRGMAQDITERRAAEARLQLQGAALEAAANAVVITDAHGIIEWANPGFTRSSGYALEEVVGRNVRLLKSGQHSRNFYRELWQTVSSGRSWTGEHINRRKDGGLYVEDATITPVSDRNGVITHYVAVNQDITQRKSLERQLVETQRLESIGLLAGGIAHDLNNILTPILLSVQLLRAEYPDETETLDVIEQCTRRGSAIVRQVLTFSRGMDGTREPMRISRLIEELGQLMAETLPKNISITYDLTAKEDTARVDATQIHQVLLNLAVNARDAMPDGGQLAFRLTNAWLTADETKRVATQRAGRYVVIAVSDTGSGIPPEILPRIFDPFFTTKPRGKGTGLGLSTVHGIVRSHGGSIQVESKLGVGTTFRVYLPVDANQEAAVKSVPSSPLVAGRGRRVLVADDESPIRNVAQLVLKKYGCEVVVAENGQQAVEIFRVRSNDIDLVILDRMMPVMDGETAADIIHQLAPRIPIILATGLITDGNLLARHEDLKKTGIVTILRKPFAEEELMKIVGDLLAAETGEAAAGRASSSG